MVADDVSSAKFPGGRDAIDAIRYMWVAGLRARREGGFLGPLPMGLAFGGWLFGRTAEGMVRHMWLRRLVRFHAERWRQRRLEKVAEQVGEAYAEVAMALGEEEANKMEFATQQERERMDDLLDLRDRRGADAEDWREVYAAAECVRGRRRRQAAKQRKRAQRRELEGE